MSHAFQDNNIITVELKILLDKILHTYIPRTHALQKYTFMEKNFAHVVTIMIGSIEHRTKKSQDKNFTHESRGQKSSPGKISREECVN